MKKLVITALSTAVSLGLAGTAVAEDGGPQFSFGASSSFAYDINRPDNLGGGSFNALSYASLEQDRSFNIDLVQLGINGERGRATYGAKVDFGDLTKLAGDSSDGDVALQEAWIGYDMDFLGFTGGRFATPIGYEVFEPWGRSNISISYAWQMQPVNHDGLKMHGSAGGVDMMIGVANSFTVADDPNVAIPANDIDDEKAILGSIGGAPWEYFNWYVAGIYSEILDTEDRIELNAIFSGAANPGNWGLTYALEGTWRDDKNAIASVSAGDPGKDLTSWAIAAYFGTSFGPTNLDFRFEYIEDGGILTNGFNPGFAKDTNLWEITTTFGWELVEGVDFRVEYRHDEANDPIYTDNGGSKKSNDVIQAQLVWYPEI
jgi:hypothetical protein